MPMRVFTLRAWVGSCHSIQSRATLGIHSHCIATHMQPMIQSALQIIQEWCWMIAILTTPNAMAGEEVATGEAVEMDQAVTTEQAATREEMTAVVGHRAKPLCPEPTRFVTLRAIALSHLVPCVTRTATATTVVMHLETA